jgi:hypothetical protein
MGGVGWVVSEKATEDVAYSIAAIALHHITIKCPGTTVFNAILGVWILVLVVGIVPPSGAQPTA